MARLRLSKVCCIKIIAVLLVVSAAVPALAQELRILSLWPSVMVNYMRQNLIPQFEAEHGVRISIDAANWDNRSDKIVVSIVGGVPYDIIVTGAYSPAEEGSRGLLAPLNKYLEEWEHTQHFPPPLWEATKWGDNIYVIPNNVDLRGFAYNRGMFAEAGLDPNSPPNSWEELLRVSRIFTRVEGGQALSRGFEFTKTTGGAAQEYFWFMKMAGIDEIDVTTFTSNLNRPEALAALTAMVEIAEANAVDLPSIPNGFSDRKIAMARQHPGLMRRSIEQNPDLMDEYDIFLPRMSPDSPPVAHAFVNGVAILEASQNKDLAWKFIAYLYEEENLMELERISGYFAGRTDLVEHQMEIHPKIELFYNLFPYMQSTVLPPPRNTAQTELGDLILRVYRREMPPQEALIHAHQTWTRLLAEWENEIVVR